jgi:hypothetical protein
MKTMKGRLHERCHADWSEMEGLSFAGGVTSRRLGNATSAAMPSDEAGRIRRRFRQAPIYSLRSHPHQGTGEERPTTTATMVPDGDAHRGVAIGQDLPDV